MLEREEYRALMAGIEPEEALREKTLSRALEEAAGRPAARNIRRAMVAAAVCLVLAALSVTVAAAAIPSFRAWLFGPESGFADNMEPLDIACEDQGIRMEVMGAAASGDTAVVYFTLRDISGKNRLDETTAVGVDSRRVSSYQREAQETGELDRAGCLCSLLDFDRETGTVLMRLQITANRNISEKPLDFTVFLMTSKSETGYFALPLTESLLTGETLPIGGWASYEISERGKTPKVSRYTPLEDSMIEEEYDSTPYYRDETGVPVVLKPLEEPLALPGTALARLSAVGYVDGILRVQVFAEDGLLDYENPIVRAELLPRDCDLGRMAEDSEYAAEIRDGMPWLYRNSVGTFGVPEDFGRPVIGMHFYPEARYDEEAYEIPREGLERYQAGAFVSYEETRLRGEWAAELPRLSELEERLVTLNGPELSSGAVERLEISTLGLFVKSTVGVLKDVDTVTVYCGEEAAEYQRVTGSNSLFSFESREDLECPATAKYAAKRPVDPARVTAVEIGGERVEVGADSAGG